MWKFLSIKKYQITKSRFILIFAILAILVLGITVYALKSKSIPTLSPYPDGKNFAFTITDDPDNNKLFERKLIYDFLTEVGLRTTIAVWVKDPTRSNGFPDIPLYLTQGGDSCEQPDYLKYMQDLQKKGFEIALHTVSSGNDYREETIKGYEQFKTYFGNYPSINIMHAQNLENVYWGKKVVENGLIRRFISLFSSRSNIPYSGEVPQSQYFWGDILKQKTKYVRLWGTSDINTLKFNPSMPYHNPSKPYVNCWFSFSDGKNVNIFNQLLSDNNIKRLVNERGASIVYLHFASGFVMNGQIKDTFKNRIIALTQQKDGWFVPATTLLDRLLIMKKVKLKVNDNILIVTNFNRSNVDGITVLVHPNEAMFNSRGVTIEANEEGEIVLESLKPGESYIMSKNRKFLESNEEYLTNFEKLNLLFQRAMVYVKHNWKKF